MRGTKLAILAGNIIAIYRIGFLALFLVFVLFAMPGFAGQIGARNSLNEWPGVIDVQWVFEQVLFVYVNDNGQDRSDMAARMCGTLADQHDIIRPMLVYVFDAQAVLRRDRKNARLGRARCNLTLPKVPPN